MNHTTLLFSFTRGTTPRSNRRRQHNQTQIQITYFSRYSPKSPLEILWQILSKLHSKIVYFSKSFRNFFWNSKCLVDNLQVIGLEYPPEIFTVNHLRFTGKLFPGIFFSEISISRNCFGKYPWLALEIPPKISPKIFPEILL